VDGRTAPRIEEVWIVGTDRVQKRSHVADGACAAVIATFVFAGSAASLARSADDALGARRARTAPGDCSRTTAL
jgi:hypothetical protein